MRTLDPVRATSSSVSDQTGTDPGQTDRQLLSLHSEANS